MKSEIGRFPRLFRGAETHSRPHLADASLSAASSRSCSASWRSGSASRGPATPLATHRVGTIAAVLFSGDLVEYEAGIYTATPI